MATPPPSAQGKETLNAIADPPMSLRRSASRTLPTHFTSLAKSESTIRKQIANIPALVEDAVLRLFRKAGRATESSPDTKVVSMFQAVVNTAPGKGFRSVAFCSAVQEAVHKRVAEPYSVNVISIRMIDAPFFTACAAEAINKEKEKGSLGKAKVDALSTGLAEAVNDKKSR